MRVEDDQGYVLHKRPYRDDSVIAELFTRQNGRLSVVIKGLQRGKNHHKVAAQPFYLLNLSYRLKTGLCTLNQLELVETFFIPSQTLIFAQYLNELLLYLLPEHAPSHSMFLAYRKSLYLIANAHPLLGMRLFELALLKKISGLPMLDQTADTQQAVEPSKNYYFYPQHGVYLQRQLSLHSRPKEGTSAHFPARIQSSDIFVRGEQLLATQMLMVTRPEDLDETHANLAKPLLQFCIQQLLGGRRLKTRDIYRALYL